MKCVKINAGVIFVIALALVAFLIPLTNGVERPVHHLAFPRQL